MKFINLGSGSKGNCTLISNNKIHILIDCGLSLRRINSSLAIYDLTINDIGAIFLTHSHSDHISGLNMILKHYNIKIYGLTSTLQYIINMLNNNNINVDYYKFYPIFVKNCNNDTDLISINNDIKILPCYSYHDVDWVFYKIYMDDKVLAILTDCGMFNEYIIRTLDDVNYLMLEYNYDENNLLQYKYYPYDLKMRILGEKGHLSNLDCTSIIKELIYNKLKIVCLSHISEHTMKDECCEMDYTKFAINFFTNKLVNDYKINVNNISIIAASQNTCTEIINE